MFCSLPQTLLPASLVSYCFCIHMTPCPIKILSPRHFVLQNAHKKMCNSKPKLWVQVYADLTTPTYKFQSYTCVTQVKIWVIFTSCVFAVTSYAFVFKCWCLGRGVDTLTSIKDLQLFWISNEITMGGTRLKSESWKIRIHTKNASWRHFSLFLKDFWILKSSCSLKSPTHAFSLRQVKLGVGGGGGAYSSYAHS